MKFCINCMAKLRDEKDVCPYCGWQQGKGVRDSLELVPGSMLSSDRYMVGRAKFHDKCRIGYIGWDYLNKTSVTIWEYAPSKIAVREVGNPLMTTYTSADEDLYGEGLSSFLETGNLVMEKQGTLSSYWRLQDCFVENGTGYIVQDLMDGQTIAELLDQGHVFDVESAVQIIERVLHITKAFQSETGRCHLAIRPDTIYMIPDGSLGLVFPETEAEKLSVRLDEMQNVYGAEELYRSRGHVTFASDVYAAAAVLYRMITGKEPVMAQSRLIEDRLIDPVEYQRSIPANVQNAILNALQVREENRTKTPGDFLGELSASKVQRVNVKQPERVSKTVKGKRLRNLLIVVGVIAALMIIAGTYYQVSQRREAITTGSEQSLFEHKVPYLEGQSLEKATELAEKSHFKVEVVEYRILDNARDEVYEQSPKANTKTKETTIKLILSGADEVVSFPDLTDLSTEEVKDKLASCNLQVTDIEARYDDSVKRGDIIEIKTISRKETASESAEEESEEDTAVESPIETNAVVDQGSCIKLYLSKGSYADVPSFSGSEIENAVQSKSIGEEPSNSSYDGQTAYGSLQKMIDQALSEQSEIEEMVNGEAVEETVPMHFSILRNSADDQYSDSIAAGHIISLADSKEDSYKPIDEEGNPTQLTVIVSKGPNLRQIPSVVGMSKKDAESALKNAGFVPVTGSSVYNDKYASGTVCAQSSAGKAKPNTNVTITISLGKKPVERKEVKPEENKPNPGATDNKGNEVKVDNGNLEFP